MPGLPRATFEVPLDAGLITRGDKRAKDEPAAERLLNAEFDDVGGLRVRFPFGVTSTNITGGGTLTNCRKFARRNDELLVFTDVALYAWSPTSRSWTYRGDHLAVMTDEQTVFSQTDDQTYAERAEFNGQIVYTWVGATPDGITGAANGIYVAVVDKATGATIQAPTAVATIGLGVVAGQPKLVVMTNCVMLLFVNNYIAVSVTLRAVKITLSPFLMTAASSPLLTFHDQTTSYDVAMIPGQDRFIAVANQAGTSSSDWGIVSCDESFTLARQLAYVQSITGIPVWTAISPDASTIMLGQGSGADVYPLPPTGAPTALPIAFNASVLNTFQTSSDTHTTGVFLPTKVSGQYRCYVFGSGGLAGGSGSGEVNSAVFNSSSNWIDVTGATGTAAYFIFAAGLASKAFVYNGAIYLWMSFAGLSIDVNDPTGTHSQLQNTYYLYRQDGFLVAKAVWGEGGGFQSFGWLPTVAVDSATPTKFLVMQAISRIVSVAANAGNPITGAQAYAERAPREVAFTFDDDRARRSLQIGNTLYITGGLVLQYDGQQLTEVGFCVYPWLAESSNGSSGTIAAGGYSYKLTERWNNSGGEIDRSTTGTVVNWTIGSSLKIQTLFPYLYITRKSNVAIEAWRTAVSPAPGVPFFLATSQNPATTSGDNMYVTNSPTTNSLVVFTDNDPDATLTTGPANPENGSVLANIEPPPASIIMTDAQRLYLAGIPGYPNTVYYSKYWQPGFVVAFNDYLSFQVPTDGGAIVALDYLDGGLIVWCETATYQYVGTGFGDDSSGSNFQLQRTLSPALGAVSQEAIGWSEEGWYVKTARGWNLLDKGLNYTDIDEGPYRYDAEEVVAVVAMNTRHQVRVVTTARVMMLDTLVKKWAEWTISDGVDMVVDSSGACSYLTATGSRQEITTWDGYAGTDTSLTQLQIETTWMKPDGRQQGRYIIDFLQLLGEYRSPCVIEAQLAKDYEQTSPGNPNWHTDTTWSPFPTINGSGLERRTAPTKKRCASIKARYTVKNPDGSSPLGGPCVRLTSITGLYAVEPGVYSAIASAQKD